MSNSCYKNSNILVITKTLENTRFWSEKQETLEFHQKSMMNLPKYIYFCEMRFRASFSLPQDCV